MKHYLRYPLILMTLLLLGCKREVCQDLGVVEQTATLIWYGDYELDGCGYSVEIGENKYKPENESDIDESFKNQETSAGTAVKLTFLPRGRKLDVSCGMMPATDQIDYIKILSIEKL